MLNSHRLEYILKQINRHDRVSVAKLVNGLQVSDETIRRDLKDLEKEGLLRRIHGGAIGVSFNRDNLIGERTQRHVNEKDIIAKLAVDLIADQTTIFINIGSTTEALARQLVQFSNLKVYTNSLNVAQIANEHFGVSVCLTPGQLRKDEFDLIGSDTISYMQDFYFDTALMSVAGVDLERGFMDFNEDEVRVRQALIKCSRNRVVMADSSKFGKTANMRTAIFEDVDRIVTDKRPATEFCECFDQAKTEVIHG